MTFLDLCKYTRQEAGIAGIGPLSVLNQIGELDRIISWVKQAYEDVQDYKIDWEFLRNDFSFVCTNTVSTYPKTSVTNFANWKKDSFRIYLGTTDDEQWLDCIDWTIFRDSRLKGASRNVIGRPTEFSIKPDKSLVFWPMPDNNYIVNGEYYRTAHVMVNDTDTPIFDRLHMVIVFNAVMRYASYVESPTLFAKAQREYSRLINKLEVDELPNVSIGSAMV